MLGRAALPSGCHLARDGREHAIRLLDSYSGAEATDVEHVIHRRTRYWVVEKTGVAGALVKRL